MSLRWTLQYCRSAKARRKARPTLPPQLPRRKSQLSSQFGRVAWFESVSSEDALDLTQQVRPPFGRYSDVQLA
jgi:hypothetical protein